MTEHTHIFVSGISMQPAAIRAQWPGSQFVARTRIEASRAEVNAAFANALPESEGTITVWGLTIEISADATGEHRMGVTDDGRGINLALVEALLLDGNPEDVVAAALYWELPPAYTAVLRAAAGVAAPEAEGGWESPLLEAETPAVGS